MLNSQRGVEGRFTRSAHQTPSKPTPFEMSRKYLIFATIVLALAAAHAEEGPKVTHKVRAGEAFAH